MNAIAKDHTDIPIMLIIYVMYYEQIVLLKKDLIENKGQNYMIINPALFTLLQR